jgi:hypothetical protein
MKPLAISTLTIAALAAAWTFSQVSPGLADGRALPVSPRRYPAQTSLAAGHGGATLVKLHPGLDSHAVPSRRLFDSIRFVESRGNDRAVGDEGRAHGPYQIHSGYWADACRFGGVRWDYNRLVWSRPHCEQVMAWYWRMHGATTDEQRARMHNGGILGCRNSATLPYWNKVNLQLRTARVGGTRAAAR